MATEVCAFAHFEFKASEGRSGVCGPEHRLVASTCPLLVDALSSTEHKKICQRCASKFNKLPSNAKETAIAAAFERAKRPRQPDENQSPQREGSSSMHDANRRPPKVPRSPFAELLRTVEEEKDEEEEHEAVQDPADPLGSPGGNARDEDSPTGRVAALTEQVRLLAEETATLRAANDKLIDDNKASAEKCRRLEDATARAKVTIEKLNGALKAKASGSTLSAIHDKMAWLEKETIRAAVKVWLEAARHVSGPSSHLQSSRLS